LCGYLYWPDEFGVSWAEVPAIDARVERIRKLPG
jgi:glutathione S-transferase